MLTKLHLSKDCKGMKEKERSGQNSRQKKQQVEPKDRSISDVVKGRKANRAETECVGRREELPSRGVTGADLTQLL